MQIFKKNPLFQQQTLNKQWKNEATCFLAGCAWIWFLTPHPHPPSPPHNPRKAQMWQYFGKNDNSGADMICNALVNDELI